MADIFELVTTLRAATLATLKFVSKAQCEHIHNEMEAVMARLEGTMPTVADYADLQNFINTQLCDGDFPGKMNKIMKNFV